MNLVFLSALLCAALVTTSGRAIDDFLVRVITIAQNVTGPAKTGHVGTNYTLSL